MSYPASYQQQVLSAASGRTHRLRLTPLSARVEDIERALVGLAGRTELLRTRVFWQHGQLVQDDRSEEHPEIMRSWREGDDLVVELAAENFDRGSVAAFAGALAEAYAGEKPDDEALQYADFASWQRGSEQSEDASDAHAYWARLMDSLPMQGHLSALEPLECPSSILQTATIACSAIDQMDLADIAGAYALLLGAHLQTTQLSIDVGFNGRNDESLEGLIGPLTSFAPVLLNVEPGQSHATVANQFRQQVAEHEQVIDCFNEAAHADAQSRYLFETAMDDVSNTFVRVRYEDGPERNADLLLRYAPNRGLLLASHRLSGEGLQVFATQLERVIMRGANAGLIDLHDLDAQAIYNPFLNSASAPEETIAGLLVATVAAFPHAEAVRDTTQSLTFTELEMRVQAFAGALRDLGVGAGVAVGLMFDRCVNYLVLQHALFRLGAVYLPLDPSYPGARLAYMVDDAECPLIIHQSSHVVAELAKGRAASVPLQHLITASATAEPVITNQLQAHDTAYMIYTSGSTGKPKGVRVAHAPVVNLLRSMSRQLCLTGDDRVLSLTTASFDMSIPELLMAQVVGACTVIAPRNYAIDPQALQAFVEAQGITFAQATPTSWRMLVVGGWTGWPKCKLLVGGEAVPPDLASALVERGREVWNMYGPTETTVWTTQMKLSGTGGIAVGQPIENTQAWVLNEALQPVGVGLAGEICITGHGLAEGYQRLPELTSEKFVAAHSLPVNTAMYRTGDIGRWRADGLLECLGRKDNQVKLHGYRIELGEIEVALREIEAIADAAALVRTSQSGDQLIAYYEAAVPLPVEELNNRMRKKLPEQMVPHMFVHVERMPRSLAGKLDRNALPEPRIEAEIEPPSTSLQKFLVYIWRELLPDASDFGVTQSFFEIGGDSLIAVQFCNRVADLAQKHVSVVSIFDQPTVSSYAAFIDEHYPLLAKLVEGGSHNGELAWSENTTIPSQTRWTGNRLPLSYNQYRAWWLDEIRPRTPAFNSLIPVWFPAGVDLTRYLDAIDQAVRSIALLNSRTIADDEEISIELVEPKKTEISRLVWPDTASSETIVAEAAAYQFALEKEAPIRVTLHQGSQGQLLVILVHQIVSDAACRQILLDRVDATLDGRPPEFDAGRYFDVVAWRDAALGNQLENLRERFAKYVGHSPGLLPIYTDQPPVNDREEGGTVVVPIDPALQHRIAAQATRHHVSEAMIYLSACCVVLHRWSGADDILLGATVSNRDQAELHHVFGRLANMVLLRCQLQPTHSIEEFLLAVRESTLASYAFNNLPFIEQARTRDWPVEEGRNIGYQVMFAVEQEPSLPQAWLKDDARKLPMLKRTSKYDLTFVIAEHGYKNRLELEYNAHLFKRATVERLCLDFVAALDGLAGSADRPVSQLMGQLSRPPGPPRTTTPRQTMSWAAYSESRRRKQSKRGWGKRFLEWLKVS